MDPAKRADLTDGGEIDTEDLLSAQMSAKAGGDQATGITWVGFIATPKDKTRRLSAFRPIRPDPTRSLAAVNLPTAFYVHSMRHATQEGFILDVLANCTSDKAAFTPAHQTCSYGRGEGGDEVIHSHVVDQPTAMKGLMGWVQLHEYNIAQRVQVVIEHHRCHLRHLLGGQAKAMVVTGSRKEAVRWQLAMRRDITASGSCSTP